MGQNRIGAVSVPALKSALPRSADFTFIADGRDKWGLGFLITTDQLPGKRSPGSLEPGGSNNTFFWIDPSRGIAGVIMMQYLPFADAKALATYDVFERGAYQTRNRGAVEVSQRSAFTRRTRIFSAQRVMVAKLAAGAGPRRPMRRASVVGCRARVTTVSAGRERGERPPAVFSQAWRRPSELTLSAAG